MPLSLDEIKQILKQLFQTLNYLHKSLGIIHRDIRPENILIANKDALSIKLTSFAFANIKEDQKRIDQLIGSPLYMSPEVTRKENYDEKIDIWSTGVVAHLLLTGSLPFDSKSL